MNWTVDLKNYSVIRLEYSQFYDKLYGSCFRIFSRELQEFENRVFETSVLKFNHIGTQHNLRKLSDASAFLVTFSTEKMDISTYVFKRLQGNLFIHKESESKIQIETEKDEIYAYIEHQVLTCFEVIDYEKSCSYMQISTNSYFEYRQYIPSLTQFAHSQLSEIFVKNFLIKTSMFPFEDCKVAKLVLVQDRPKKWQVQFENGFNLDICSNIGFYDFIRLDSLADEFKLYYLQTKTRNHCLSNIMTKK